MTVMERLANSVVVPVVVLDKVEDAVPLAKDMAAGGVNNDNIKEFIDTPFNHAVGGSWVCPKADVAAGNWDKITELCINARKAARGE